MGQDISDYNIRMITLSQVCFQLHEANFRKQDLLNGPKLILLSDIICDSMRCAEGYCFDPPFYSSVSLGISDFSLEKA